ncbi:MAG: carboxypeptidase regulatory-like domain-containing protein, partial [Actinobacteria bacterium]|nr:carboxypeptidase regulatory-like domain-containing protein [Actinomycetota bacterium]
MDVVLEPIERAELTGSVIRAGDGSPVPDARVEVNGLTVTTRSDGAGGFVLPELPVGRHELLVQAFGHDPARHAVSVQPGAGQHVTVALDPAALADDVEEDRDWQFGWVGDEAVTGIWERADPVGTGGGTVQPEDDHTPDPGTVAFITGQSMDRDLVEANDVDGGATTLVTPRFDLSGTGSAKLSYYRWFSRNAGPAEA